ncbi:Aste57867_22894 [Aphanomyces stellatus]|uniref:Aste57867_22894 protein n=1 Tax=Aphanomyces stellatus TaxID=120398 RepID=A0A485LQZ4_9STRA|nr:hypothetical protein As57867_022823 [Aphanomyces stellatus]VFT99544.1 Aste57867_22894 [Aphanomyces stellatus]
MRKQQQQAPEPAKIWLFDESMLDRPSSSAVATYDVYKDVMHSTDAIRPGGAIPLLSRASLGLLAQYAAVGVVYGLLPRLDYPVYFNYLNFTGTQIASYNALLGICWTLKVFLGILTDCFPIFRYRRRSYMVLGWTITFVACLVMTLTPFPAPFLAPELNEMLHDDDRRQVRAGNFTSLNATLLALVHEEASHSATLWIFLSVVASLGYLIADVAADAMVVQYAHREPMAIRGRMQSVTFGVRFAASILPQAIFGFCLNGKVYGGTFDWSISPNVAYGVLLAPCLWAIAAAMFWVDEDAADRVALMSYMHQLWDLLKLRVVWQICAFRFFSNLFFGFDSTAAMPIMSKWAKVAPLVQSWYTILTSLLMSAAVFGCGKWGLQWDWRRTIAITTVAVVVIDATMVFGVTWNLFRDPYIYVGGLLSDTIPGGIRWIIAAYCAVEIADMGNEGVVNALVTSIVNMSDPFAVFLYKVIDSYFDKLDLQDDTTEVRWQVSATYIIAFAMKLLSLGFLVFLPSQKAAVQLLKRKGGASHRAAVLLVTGFAIALLFSLTTCIMALVPSTSCYRIAGGDGNPIVEGNVTICGTRATT